MGQKYVVKWGQFTGQVGEKITSYSLNKQTYYSLRLESGTIEHILLSYLVPYKKPKEPKKDASV